MRMHQGSELSPFAFAVMVDVVTEFARESAPSELLYADDLVMMSETIEGLRNKFLKWKEAFESKGFKVNLGKPKVVVFVSSPHQSPRCCVSRFRSAQSIMIPLSVWSALISPAH